MWSSITEIFNNREIASAFWLVVFLLVLAKNKGVRRGMRDIVRAFCRRIILIVIFFQVAYVFGVVLILHMTGFWTLTILKETIMWFIFSGAVLTFNHATKEGAEGLFKKMIVNNLKVVVILEFLIGTYTFSLLVELILLPIVTIIVIFTSLEKSKDEYASAAKFFGGIEAFIGITILAVVVFKAIADLKTLWSLASIQSILVAPVLSICLIPFIFGLNVYSSYEDLFFVLRFNLQTEPKVTRYLKRRLIFRLGLRLSKIRQFPQKHLIDIQNIRTKVDVDKLLDNEKEANG